MTNQIDLSVVIPAYYEEKRIPKMLQQTLSYLVKSDLKFEIIVVNDEGARKDKTTEVSLKFSTFEGREIDLKVVEY